MNRLLVACALVVRVASTAAQSQPVAAIVPVVDHHQHLLSPELAAAWSPPVPAPIELPPELQRRFGAGAPRYNDSAAIADFYTENALVSFSQGALFLGTPTNWIRGRGRVAGFLSRAFRNQYSLTPVAYGVNDSSGFIVGYFSGIPRHYDVHLSLRKDSDGAWRIAAQSITYAPRPTLQAVTAEDLIALLDTAGIRRALVLSVAYTWGSPALRGNDEYAQVRRENDWTGQQVTKYSDRLRAFCSFNPLRDYALAELDRCAKDPNLHYGLKLHFANSDVDLRNPAHVEQLRQVFRAANAHRMPVVIHLWTGDEQVGHPYGRAEAQIFLNDILPAAPDIPIQIAHLAGSGPRLDPGSKDALAMFADAVAAHNPRTRNLYFDVATNVTMQISAEDARFIAAHLRQIGLQRILYGSDLAIVGNLPPRQGWGVFRAMIPLTEAEFRTIAENVAPYMR